MKAAAALASVVLLAVVACGPFHRLGTQGAAASSAREASPGRVASPPRITLPKPPTSTPAPPPVAGYSTAPCQVPMSAITEAQGYFVAYPDGATTEAPGSVVALPGGDPGATGANYGLAYDKALQTWVPVPLDWVAPSGAHYVYEENSLNAIHVVDVETGAVQILVAHHGWYVVGVTDDGAFVADYFNPGVWFVSFADPTPVRIAGGRGWSRYNDGVLWLQSGGVLLRHSVSTGAERVVARIKGWFSLDGFDRDGSPVVETSPSVPSSDPKQAYALKEVTKTGSMITLYSKLGGRPGGYVFGDDHGVWFEVGDSSGDVNAGPSGLYLWTKPHGAKRVNNVSLNLMGPCA